MWSEFRRDSLGRDRRYDDMSSSISMPAATGSVSDEQTGPYVGNPGSLSPNQKSSAFDEMDGTQLRVNDYPQQRQATYAYR